ncbi:DUF5994 family protein [Streptomyces sp. MA15]|nr:DUF5994 family protein [Streptomyces sp. MA15]MDN3268174.1 DUF5994 family protein [Streptomyces sp. MA15]
MWWPHSRDLLTQLPKMLAAPPSAWGDIAGVTVGAAAWSAAPGRMFVANQAVRLHKAPASPHAQDRVVLLSPGLGRWDLLVVPPDATEEAAALLMATALDDRVPDTVGEVRTPVPTAATGPGERVGPTGWGPVPLGGRRRRGHGCVRARSPRPSRTDTPCRPPASQGVTSS